MVNVIFDTNAAREFVSGVSIETLDNFAQNMAESYNTKKLRLLISPVVIMELLCHLCNDADYDYSVSFKAIKAIMLTQEFQLGEAPRGIMSPGELLVANEIYHMHCEMREKMYMGIMNVAEIISHQDINNLPDLHTSDGLLISDYVAEIEDTFVHQIREVCSYIEILAKDNGDSFEVYLNKPEQECLLAMYFTRTTYGLLMNEGKVVDYKRFIPPFSPPTESNLELFRSFVRQMEENNKEVIRRYPAFISLAKEVVRRIHQNKDISDNKLRNYIWDINLMFHVNDHTLCREPVIFITNDKAMILASGAFHDSEKVLKFDEFKQKYNL